MLGRTFSPQWGAGHKRRRLSVVINRTTHQPSTNMYAAGIMDHFSSTPKMELVVWGSTMALYASSAFRFRNQYRSARSTAGDIKPGSTGPRILTSVAILGQFCGSALPPLVYLTATAYNKFRQPEWMTEYALPSPPDVFGVDGVLVGRAVGLLAVLAGSVLTRAALKILGDQFHAIGVSAIFSCRLSNTDRESAFFLGYRFGRNPDLLKMGRLHTSDIQSTRKFPIQYSPFTEPCPLRFLSTAGPLFQEHLSLLHSGRIFLSTPCPL